jgi:UDP-N-acetylglucosamine 2-epimerase (hydrolysing)
LGENAKNIYVIGSPDIDVMKSDQLPDIEFVKEYYEIPFRKYAIMAFHPITTEPDTIGGQIREVSEAIIKSGKDYVIIYPNNDLGTEIILDEIMRLKGKEHFRIYPSIRFEYFLTLLKNADFIVGNSSAGIRESGIYGIPAIDVGTRQNGRYDIEILKNIQHVEPKKHKILDAINRIDGYRVKNDVFGNGNSTKLFMDIIENEEIWSLPLQKIFIDYSDL